MIPTLALLAGLAAAATAPAELERALEDAVCCGHARYYEAVKLFSELEKAETLTPKAIYRAAFAEIQLHRLEDAGEHLRKLEEDFTPPKGWPSAESLIERVRQFESNRPPWREQYGSIVLHAHPENAWTGPVVSALPEFEKIGKRLYGDKLPPIRFFLFRESDGYEPFYAATFGMPIPGPTHDGTGNRGIALYRQSSQRQAGQPETIANVLHEFGHAWANSYVAERHGKDYLSPALRRPYLDEGLADYVASLHDPEHLTRRRQWIEESKLKATPPKLSALRAFDSFYKGDVELNYWVSALLVARMLGRAPDKLVPLLDALATSGDDRTAWELIGLDLQKEYAKMVKQYWGKKGVKAIRE